MEVEKASAARIEHPEHEAVLTGVVALAAQFSNCVEAFGLIHAAAKPDKNEQKLLAQLGLQQARLLIWGDAVGICSPPKSVTNSAVPKHPSAVYPDLKEPTFFANRDPRLDEPAIRTAIEASLSAIVDCSANNTREQMMAQYGLRSPRKIPTHREPALDSNRLEAFRERHELLREVADSYAHISTGRSSSILFTSWMIVDSTKFVSFIRLCQDTVDHLIDITQLKERVDRGLRMDIRSFGWHVAPDKVGMAYDTAKLQLLKSICSAHYPEYVEAIEEALAHINREARESTLPQPIIRTYSPPQPLPTAHHGDAAGAAAHKKRPGLLKLFRSFSKSKENVKHNRHSSDTGPSTTTDDNDAGPARSKSDAGPAFQDPAQQHSPTNTTTNSPDHLSRTRSKSVGGVPEHLLPPVIRHDQYQGIARTQTKDLHQGDY